MSANKSCPKSAKIILFCKLLIILMNPYLIVETWCLFSLAIIVSSILEVIIGEILLCWEFISLSLTSCLLMKTFAKEVAIAAEVSSFPSFFPLYSVLFTSCLPLILLHSLSPFPLIFLSFILQHTYLYSFLSESYWQVCL